MRVEQDKDQVQKLDKQAFFDFVPEGELLFA